MKKTRERIEREIGTEGYKIAIVNDCIEDWLGIEYQGFDKLKFMLSIDDIIDSINFNELRNKDRGFNEVIAFMDM